MNILRHTDKNEYKEKFIDTNDLICESFDLWKKISSIINDQAVIWKINLIDSSQRWILLGFFIQFLIICRIDHIDWCLNYLDNMQKELSLKKDMSKIEDIHITFLVQFIRINILKVNQYDEEENEMIYNYIVENWIQNWFAFHWFNGAIESYIRENWLSNTYRIEDEKDVEIVNNIFKKYGIDMIFWRRNTNCQNTLSLSENPSYLYNYALSSPEWFSQFCGWTHWYSGIDHIDRDSYLKKDFNWCKINVNALINKLNFLQEEKNIVLCFFDKYWSNFINSDSEPKCALIPKKNIYSKEYLDSFKGYLKNIEWMDDDFNNLVSCVLWSLAIDIQINHSIPIEDLIIIDFPDYSKIF